MASLCALQISAPASIFENITAQGEPSQTTDHGSGRFPAENAVDGDISTTTHTDSSSNGSAWELHFPEEKPVERIEVIPRADCCSGRLSGALLTLTNASNLTVFEIPVIDNGPGQLFTAEVPEGTLADHLRIGFDPGVAGIVHIAEVRVFAGGGEAPVIDSFTSSGNTLTWSVSGEDTTVEISGVGSVTPSGSTVVAPSESRPYVLTATNPCDSVQASTAVIVDGRLPDLEITEFSAFGDGPDWVEIWNPGNSPIGLGGYHLTDDPDKPTKWPVPAGEIVAGGFSVVEPSFGLAREPGSYLALVAPDGTAVSEFTYPEQDGRATYGSDLGGVENFYLEPTRGTFNSGATTLGFLSAPTYSVERGFHELAFSLELTAVSGGSTIYFTTDGTDPIPGGETASPYSSPIQIERTTVVRAAEHRDGYEPSDVVAHTYLFLDDVIGQTDDQPTFPANWIPVGTGASFGPGDPPRDPALFDYAMDPRVGVTAADLKTIPTICISMPAVEMFDPEDGLHANGSLRGDDWERPASLEIIDPATGVSKETGCGIRIHGGRGRIKEVLKKSFRLYFRDRYGDAKLDYPLFGSIPEDGIDHLILRSGTGKSWAATWKSRESLGRTTYLRDEFYRERFRAMGNLSIAGNFTHLYINGVYWGLYNNVERPGAHFASNHLGGPEEDYEILKWANGKPADPVAGDTEAWDAVLALARGNPASNNVYAMIAERVDIDNLIDYMIVNFWAGNGDWVGNNSYAYRRRSGGDGKFRFLCWDGEEIFNSLSANSTGKIVATNPIEIHEELRSNPIYRLRFADRVHRHITDEDGALTTANARASFEAMAAEIDRAIVGESSRWGDLLYPSDPPVARGTDWLPEIALLRGTYLGQRPGISLGHMESDGLLAAAPTPRARLLAPTSVVITAPSGTVYYTTDGSDPRLSNGSVNPTALVATSGGEGEALLSTGDTVWSYLDTGNSLDGSTWKLPTFNDDLWPYGRGVLGYGSLTGTAISTQINFGNDPDNKHITSYFRGRFNLEDPSEITGLEMDVLYDDGAVVYLNGTEIFRGNMDPGAVTSGDTSSITLPSADEGDYTRVSPDRSLLVAGTNVIAAEVHQSRGESSDLGFDTILTAVRATGGQGGIALSGDTHIKARVRSVGGDWSALEEEFFQVSDPVDLVISEVHYFPSGPDPDRHEYIEFKNTGPFAADLTGMRLTKGVDFDFAPGTTIAAGQTALVVADVQAFESRFGAGHTVVGEWETGDKLSDSGERIRLRAADDSVVIDFTYGTSGNWPALAPGKSLVLTSGDPAAPFAWRPGNATPASTDSTTFPGGTPDDFSSYIFGAAPVKITSHLLEEDKIEISITYNGLAGGVTRSLESSSDLVTWTGVEGATPISIRHHDGGMATLTVEISAAEGRQIFRYSIVQP